MLLKTAQVSTRQFTYIEATRTFSAEISSTNGLGRVYDDSADEGLTLVSSRTGAERTFVVTGVTRDADGDVMWWSLTSTQGGYNMILWND